ncbi:helix-turn-helix domain-containing protein [Leifsonia sp. Le1]|uniref:helix-turn-helix domain-containing protein n=1 Tax=Leifsonia sp. Le1 TaxID=3404918 RepID=UPI003EBF3E48
MTKGKLLLVPEIAERLRRSEQAVRYQIHRGALAPTAVVGGRRVMAEEDLEAYIEAQFERSQLSGALAG